MMDNESLRGGSKNTVVIFLSLVLAVALCWAIYASVMASKSRANCERLAQEKEQIRIEAEQIRIESERRMMEADKLRKTALDWTRQHQLQVQAEMRQKAAAAAAAAKPAVKPAASKTTAKTGASKSTTTKKTVARH